MDSLKDIINSNPNAFNKTMPFGNTFSFITRLLSLKRMKVWLLVPAFASLAIVFAIILPGKDESVRIYKDYCKQVAIISSEIETIISPEEFEILNNQLYSITNEPITLFEQLPEEMHPKQRAKILKDYYTQKINAVTKLKAMVAMAEIED